MNNEKLNNRMNYCSNCGNKLNNIQNFCPNCGTKVSNSNDDFNKNNVKDLFKKYNLLIWGMAILMAILGVVFSIIIGDFFGPFPAMPGIYIVFCLIFKYFIDKVNINNKLKKI